MCIWMYNTYCCILHRFPGSVAHHRGACKRARTCYITAHNSQKTITSANEYHFTAWRKACVYVCVCVCVCVTGNARWPTALWRQCQHVLCKQVLNLDTSIVTFSRDLIMMWCTYEWGEKLCKSQLKLYIICFLLKPCFMFCGFVGRETRLNWLLGSFLMECRWLTYQLMQFWSCYSAARIIRNCVGWYWHACDVLNEIRVALLYYRPVFHSIILKAMSWYPLSVISYQLSRLANASCTFCNSTVLVHSHCSRSIIFCCWKSSNKPAVQHLLSIKQQTEQVSI